LPRCATALCLHAAVTCEDDAAPSALPAIAAPGAAELATLALPAPMMPGAEHLTPDILLALWTEPGAALSIGLAAAETDLRRFLKGLDPAWSLVDAVCAPAPGRLARPHAHQRAGQEFAHTGVEAVFLDYPIGQTPESGLVSSQATYERIAQLEWPA